MASNNFRDTTLVLALLVVLGGCGPKEAQDQPTNTAPDRTAARIRMTKALLAEGHVDAAREQLAKLAVQPGSEVTQTAQPVWFEELVESLLRRGALDIADSLLTLTGPEAQRPAEVKALTANFLVLKGEVEAAIATWSSIRTDDPVLQVRMHHELATLYLKTERAREAYDEAQLGLAINPAHGPLRILLAESLRAQSRPREALSELAMLPESTARRLAEADIFLRELEQPDSAAIFLRAAVRSAPQDPNIRQMLAEADLLAGRPARALAPLHRLASMPVPFDRSRELLAQAYRGVGQIAAADSLQSILDAESKRDSTQRLRVEGLRASMAGDLELALQRFEEALAISPESADLHNDRGAVLARSNRYDEAEADFLKAAELAPNDPTVYENLARLYARTGQDAKRDVMIARWKELTQSSDAVE